MTTFEQAAAATDDAIALNLQRASDFQATLLGIAAHDLRQPLQVIQTAYEWLGSRVAGVPEKMRLERGERAIARLTEQLDRLVGALRLYEHTRRVALSPVPLGPLLRHVADDNAETAREKQIDLRVCLTTAVIMSNATLLESILSNLVRNAIKYTRPGGRILVGCRRVKDKVRIEVYDTGVGMAPEHLPRIFEAFQRLDTASADGLGIGLFVVRRAVELLNHNIEVSSVVARGSRFSVLASAVK